MKKIFLFSLYFLTACVLKAQPVNNYLKNVIMPSPTAASLGKYTDIPIGYHTGVPNISVPIHQLTEGPLTLPISLNYHASGVKVGEAASWVGQNWSLNAGGIVSRTVQGLKDEEAANGWLKSAAVPAPPVFDNNGNIISGDYCGFTEHYWNEQKDGEPDIFSFNAGGMSGKFYFKKDGNVVLVPLQDILIVPQFSASASDLIHLKGFTITSPDGTKYLFGDIGDGSPAVETNIGDGGNYPEIPSSWYLKKIESADGKYSIALNYTGDYSRTDYQPNRVSPCNTQAPGGDGVPNVSSSYTFVKGHRITSIVTSTETVTFTPGAAREDLEVYPLAPYNTDPPKVLASITISTAPYQKKFDLSYDYWVDNSSDQVTAPNAKLNKRLRLLSVQEKSITDPLVTVPAWTFEYFTKTGAPTFMPHRISRSIDHWGFYNEKSNGSYNTTEANIPGNLSGTCINGQYCNGWGQTRGAGTDRSTNETAMKYGTLKKLTYPTGGFTEFDFEANTTYSPLQVNDTINVISIDGAYSSGGFTCSPFQFYGNPQNYSFSSGDLNLIRYEWKLKPNTTNCQCVEGVTSLRVKVYNATTGAYYSQSALYNISCTPTSGSSGSGLMSAFFSPALQANVSYKFELEVTQGGGDFKLRLPIVNNSGNYKIGGLRVKQVRTHDGISTSNDLIRTYEYLDSTIVTRSSGILYGTPNYVYSYSWFPCRNPQQCGSVCAPSQCPLYQNPSGGCNVNFYEQSITPLSSFEGYHVGYYYVKELFNGNGSKTYTYYTEINNDPPQFPTPPAPARVLAGNLRYSTTRNASGSIVATESHVANNDVYTESTDVMYKKVVNSCGRFVTVYKIRTKPYRESSVTNVVDGVSKATNYGYDTQNRHLQKVTEDVTDADGTVYRTKYKYSMDFPCASGNNCDEANGSNNDAKAIYAMRKRFMISMPIEQTTWVKRPSWGSFRLTLATFFQYDKVNTSYNNLKLKTVQQVKPASPLTTFTEASITGGVFSKSSSYATEYNFVYSDVHGNLLSQWKQNDPSKQQYIWGHKNKLPIAKIINAEDTEVAFTSFEEQNNSISQGNWTLAGALGGWNTSPGNFMTGTTGFNLSPARTITKSVPAGKYVVSGWHKDGSFVVNGATVSTSTGGQWKFAEKEITLAAAGTITVSSGGSDWSQFIDELRLFPSDALMTTYSFDDRVLLLLSTSDENSVSTHYDFDVLKRLQAVRDVNRDIVKATEYNYHAIGSAINDIKTRTVLTAGQTTIAQVNALIGANVHKSYQYLDGISRIIQVNEVAQSPTAKDVITHRAYDIYNREAKKYIPYTIASNGGLYRSGAAAEQLSFANTWGAGGYGYSDTRFEVSPLNRAVEVAAPGAIWRIGLGHTNETSYRGNTVADAVRDFTNNNSFVANKLFVEETTDENEHKKWTFKDKTGRVLLVKQELNATESGLTYTVYDDFGRIACVIPPETTKRMINSGNWDYTSATYAGMVFKYTYNSRGLVSNKTIPSGGTSTMLYDRLDRQVLTTDANGFKTFTRYDILGRVIVSGKYKGTGTPGATDPLFETPNTTGPHYYTSTSFPTDNNLDVYKVAYYDDYDIDNNGALGSGETYTDPAESGYETTAFLRTRGKPTINKAGILLASGGAPTTFLSTRTYYDDDYSTIQTNKQNQLSGSDITSNAYDFAKRVTKNRRDHTATPPGGSLKTYTIREEYVYDDASRLRFTRHKINSNNWVVTAAPAYDEIGRIQDKRLHASNYDGVSAITLNSVFNYLQSLDYTYNIRNWLTGINDPTSCATQSGDQLPDLFSASLDYESTANGGTAQYNGNIGAIQWRTNINGVCGTRQQYRFSYDFSDRLSAAAHHTHNGTAWTFTDNYSESNITYDLNGNIKSYNRKGQTAPGVYGMIDLLSYTYDDALRPDKLTKMADGGDGAKGFKRVTGLTGDHYLYDLNGNMTQDKHKGFTFTYNHLNLPVTMTQGANLITVTYTADGEKISKALSGGGATKNYVAGIEYTGANLEAIYYSEGRCTPNGATAFNYDYSIKDHLGNVRENFRANGTAVTHLEELHYYPFGMLMEGMGTSSPTNDYAYNSKELNEDFGLNLYDYGARWYDATLGRWWNTDPLGEKVPGASTYAYVMNNPMVLVDPTGMESEKYELEGEDKDDEKKASEQKATENQEAEADNPSQEASTASGENAEICIPCIVVIVVILTTAPEVDKSKTMDPERDAQAIREAENMKNEWLMTGLTAPVRAEGYAFNVLRKGANETLNAKPSKQSGKDRATDIPSWAKGQKPNANENGKAFAKRLMDEKYGAGNYNTGGGSEYSKLQKYGDRGN